MTASLEADALTRAGFDVRATSPSQLRISRGKERFTLNLVRVQTGPTRSQLVHTRSLPSDEISLFVVPKATARLQQLVADEPRAWLITRDGTMVLGDQISQDATPATARRGRPPWGRYALMRTLLREPVPRTQLQLAAESGLTQGGVSGALARLDGLAIGGRAGWTAADPHGLWRTFLSEYPGARGVGTHWYSRETFAQQNDRLMIRATLSGDAGADTVAPWRKPVRSIAYAPEPIHMEPLGFTPATADESTCDLIFPEDHTIFATAAAWRLGVADPLIIAWDLASTGGNDADEAIARLERFVLERFAR